MMWAQDISNTLFLEAQNQIIPISCKDAFPLEPDTHLRATGKTLVSMVTVGEQEVMSSMMKGKNLSV